VHEIKTTAVDENNVCIISIPLDKLKNPSIIARKFKFCSTGRSCFTWFLLVQFCFNVFWKFTPLSEFMQ